MSKNTKEQNKEYQRTWRKKHREQANATRKAWIKANPSKMRIRNRRQTKRRRLRAIEKLGGVCIHCGFADPRALQFDHIFPIRHSPRTGTQIVALQILRGATNFQLLCANCNWIKRTENNEFREPIDGYDILE